MRTNDSRETRRDEHALEANTRRVFEASVERLDGRTRARLAEARAKAASSAALGRSDRGPRERYGMAALVAAAALAFAVVWLQQPAGTPGVMELTAFEDLDILLDEEELELFEDIEFYAWLQEQPELNIAADDSDGSG